MYTPGTIANSETDTASTKINKNGAAAKVRILVELGIKTFRVISNEIPVLFLVLCWYYFSCLKMYPEKFFNAYFYEEMFFEIFVEKGDTG